MFIFLLDKNIYNMKNSNNSKYWLHVQEKINKFHCDIRFKFLSREIPQQNQLLSAFFYLAIRKVRVVCVVKIIFN